MFISRKKAQRGMAATEYIIGLILIAVGSVGVFAIFGSQIRNKVTQVTAAISGQQDEFNTAQGKDSESAKAASTENAKGSGMNNGDLVINYNPGAKKP